MKTAHLVRALALGVAVVGCDAALAADAGLPDAGTDALRAPAEPAAPELTPCPSGWGPLEVGGVTVCDPTPGGDEACPTGEARFVGSAACAPLALCPAGEFAEGLPAEALHVRPGAVDGDGSQSRPFGTLAQALSGAGAGVVIALAKGTYDEGALVPSGVTVRGACPGETILSWSSPRQSSGAAGVAAGTLGARLEGVTIRNTDNLGLLVRGEMSVRDVWIEDAQLYGVAVLGGRLTADGLVVRSTRVGPSGDQGFGVVATDGGTAVLARAVIEDNPQIQLSVGAGAEITLSDVALRRGRIGAVADLAVGIVAEGGTVSGERVEITGSRGVGGLATAGGVLTLRDVVVRGSRANGSAMGFGVAALAATVRLERAWLPDNQGTAAMVTSGGRIELTDTVVDSPIAPPGRPGWALGLSIGDRGVIVVERVLIQNAQAAALSVIGVPDGEPGAALLVGSDLSIRDVMDRGISGIGMYARATGELVLERVSVERTSDAAVVLQDARASLQDLRVTDTAPRLEGGVYGRGLEALGSEVTLRRARFESQHEVAVLLSGGVADVSDLEITDVRERGCAVDTCADAPGGIGLGVYDGAAATVERFRIEGVPLCGLQIARGGGLDLSAGSVRAAAVGACVQVEGYDIRRIATTVRYEETGTPVQTTTHRVPDVRDPLAP